MNILKRLDDLKWYNNKYIHRIEDTMYTFLSKQEICEFYIYILNNPCDKCDKTLPIDIRQQHPTLWQYKGCDHDYYRIALSRTYLENY